MATVTISKKITRGEELVVIPRKDYERLLGHGEQGKLALELKSALNDIRAGRVIGPFRTFRAGIKALKKAR